MCINKSTGTLKSSIHETVVHLNSSAIQNVQLPLRLWILLLVVGWLLLWLVVRSFNTSDLWLQKSLGETFIRASGHCPQCRVTLLMHWRMVAASQALTLTQQLVAWKTHVSVVHRQLDRPWLLLVIHHRKTSNADYESLLAIPLQNQSLSSIVHKSACCHPLVLTIHLLIILGDLH